MSCDYCGQDHGDDVQHAELSHSIWGTAGDLAPVEQVTEARQAAIEFFDFYRPGHSETVEQMLPTACSPTGENPPTHFVCWWKAKKAEIEAGIAFAKEHTKPNVIEFADSLDEFLSRHGLKVVNA